MTDRTIIIWRTKDGRDLPFNHPDALAERLEAIRGAKLSPEFLARAAAEWDGIFGKKGRCPTCDAWSCSCAKEGA